MPAWVSGWATGRLDSRPQAGGRSTELRLAALLCVTVIPVVTVLLVQTLSLVQRAFATLPPARNHLLASVFAHIHFVLWAILVNACPASRASARAETIIDRPGSVRAGAGPRAGVFRG